MCTVYAYENSYINFDVFKCFINISAFNNDKISSSNNGYIQM